MLGAVTLEWELLPYARRPPKWRALVSTPVVTVATGCLAELAGLRFTADGCGSSAYFFLSSRLLVIPPHLPLALPLYDKQKKKHSKIQSQSDCPIRDIPAHTIAYPWHALQVTMLPCGDMHTAVYHSLLRVCAPSRTVIRLQCAHL